MNHQRNYGYLKKIICNFSYLVWGDVMLGKVRLINAIVSQNLLKIIYFLT